MMSGRELAVHNFFLQRGTISPRLSPERELGASARSEQRLPGQLPAGAGPFSKEADGEQVELCAH